MLITMEKHVVSPVSVMIAADACLPINGKTKLESAEDFDELIAFLGTDKVISISEPVIIESCLPYSNFIILSEQGNYMVDGPRADYPTLEWMSELATKLRTHYGLRD